ncbi:MAG: helix-turn-helix transcriptional regulator [Desulfobacula sp.]|nr:helix-turn-helix transcriptional regulator [Desulfobacula sp.]
MKTNMTPDQIKEALIDKDISQSGLGRDLNCTPQNIHMTIKNPKRSFSTAKHIARALGKKIHEVWPETFKPGQEPPKTGRPLTKGYFDHHAA